MFPILHNRKTIRFAKYNYSKNGFYFVTMCTWQRKTYFGEIQNGEMKLNGMGEIIKQYWEEIPKHFENVFLDVYVIMPNHMHGIIIIYDSLCRGGQLTAPTEEKKSLQPKLLSIVIRTFKGVVTMECRKKYWAYKIWQRSFHDHIIRNDLDLMRIREYIQNNPRNWEMDENNINET